MDPAGADLSDVTAVGTPPDSEHRGQRADGLSVRALASAEASVGSSVPQEEHFGASGIVRSFGFGPEAIETNWRAKASLESPCIVLRCASLRKECPLAMAAA
jgi:hypothetical protein